MHPFGWGRELPKLSGSRVDLSWLTPDDAPAILAIFGDPEVTRYWSSPPLEGLAAAREWIGEIHELFRARELFQWGIRSKQTSDVLGTCTLCHVEFAHRRGEVGFALRRDRWGSGLATEAVRMLIRFSFETLGLHRLEADVDPRNERSLLLLERQGFRREGLLRERWQPMGEVQDAVFLGLLRHEWLAENGEGLRIAGARGAPLELTLERCRIRPWRRGDELSIVAHADNRSVWQNLRDLFPHPYTLEDARAWIARCESARTPTAWAIEIDGEAAGGIGLLPGKDVHRLSAEIGFWLGERHWGRGVMTEAVSALTRAAFERFDFERLHADVFDWNAASMRVLEKCGYEREGRQRRAVFKDGRFADAVVYARLRPGV